MKFDIPWKRNFRKIPNWISLKANSFSNKDLVVACVKKISAADIKNNKYSHLQISFKEGKPTFPAKLISNKTVGKYSRINVEGKEIIRKDLPMVSKSHTWEAPNWGDWSSGSHDITIDRQVYQRGFIAPKELTLSIELIAEDAKTEGLFIFKFTVEEVLARSIKSFKDNLFYNLNLLQENVGKVDVFPSDATISDYLKTIYVDWEILPPGERDSTIAKILSGWRAPTKEVREKLTRRYNLLTSLKPIAFIAGTSGFSRYFGAKFSENLVVFENLEYGNAVYIMFEGWETLSKKTKIELLRGGQKGFVRIIHHSGWENKLKGLIKEKKEEVKKPNT